MARVQLSHLASCPEFGVVPRKRLAVSKPQALRVRPSQMLLTRVGFAPDGVCISCPFLPHTQRSEGNPTMTRRRIFLSYSFDHDRELAKLIQALVESIG